MDDDDFEYDADEVAESFAAFFSEPAPQPYRRARWADIPVLGFGLLYGLSKAVTDTLGDAQALAAWHANFFVQQDEFHEQAAREIEALVAGDEDGE